MVSFLFKMDCKFIFLVFSEELLHATICAQLDLEVMCKRSKKKEYHLIYMNFGVKKFIVKTTKRNLTLMLKCYNLVDLME
jgi:hypothetical protein